MASPNSTSWPGHVSSRSIADERIPEGGDLRVFDVQAAIDINRARMDAIQAIRLPLSRARVLDAGCGPGHFVSFYASQGCEVVGIDGRAANIEEFRKRHPGVRGVVGDIQSFTLDELGRFDVIHCLGLLYHLENPMAALRNMHAVCDGVLILETIVMDDPRPVLLIDDEPKTVNQALAGVGCRPSPAFVVMALNRIGFRCVYRLTEPPQHEDFQFEWGGDGAWQRDGHPLRCMFVASNAELASAGLRSVLEP